MTGQFIMFLWLSLVFNRSSLQSCSNHVILIPHHSNTSTLAKILQKTPRTVCQSHFTWDNAIFSWTAPWDKSCSQCWHQWYVRPEAIREEEHWGRLFLVSLACCCDNYWIFFFLHKKIHYCLAFAIFFFFFYSRLLLVIKKIRGFFQDCFCGDRFIMFMVLQCLKLPLKVSS